MRDVSCVVRLDLYPSVRGQEEARTPRPWPPRLERQLRTLVYAQSLRPGSRLQRLAGSQGALIAGPGNDPRK